MGHYDESYAHDEKIECEKKVKERLIKRNIELNELIIDMCGILDTCNDFVLNCESGLDGELKMRLFEVQSKIYKIHNILG